MGLFNFFRKKQKNTEQEEAEFSLEKAEAKIEDLK